MQNVCTEDVITKGPVGPRPWQGLEAPQEEAPRMFRKPYEEAVFGSQAPQCRAALLCLALTSPM